jgi:hypothetical protein
MWLSESIDAPLLRYNSGQAKRGILAFGPKNIENETPVYMDLSELVHPGQKVCLLSLLGREGLLYFQGFARSRKPRPRALLQRKNEI